MIAERIFSVFRSLHCKFVTMIINFCVALVLKGYFKKSQEELKTALSSHPRQRGFLAGRVTFYAYYRSPKFMKPRIMKRVTGVTQ